MYFIDVMDKDNKMFACLCLLFASFDVIMSFIFTCLQILLQLKLQQLIQLLQLLVTTQGRLSPLSPGASFPLNLR